MSVAGNVPVVTIVGRPNVGKSTLFNRLAGRRLAIVSDVPGVTRDYLVADCRWRGRTFRVVDTAGLDPAAREPLAVRVREQALKAVEAADLNAVGQLVLGEIRGVSGVTNTLTCAVVERTSS